MPSAVLPTGKGPGVWGRGPASSSARTPTHDICHGSGVHTFTDLRRHRRREPHPVGGTRLWVRWRACPGRLRSAGAVLADVLGRGTRGDRVGHLVLRRDDGLA